MLFLISHPYGDVHFLFANRMEGYMDTDDSVNFTESEARKFMNDKGLVTRQKDEKDVFYLYKSLYGTTTYRLCISRAADSAKRPADAPHIYKVYSNAKKLTLYQNGTAVETMNGSGERQA